MKNKNNCSVVGKRTQVCYYLSCKEEPELNYRENKINNKGEQTYETEQKHETK